MNTKHAPEKEFNHKKILLAILPYWDPMIPPNGIAHLKQFLQKYGYQVKTVDVIITETSQRLYDDYFDLLAEFVPEEQQGNFYNLGHDVLQDHMMAHFNSRDKKNYSQLVKELVHKTYYVHITDEQVHRLNRVLDEIYSYLEDYFLDLVERERPLYVGATVYKGTMAASLFVLKVIKKTYPHIKTLIGGGAFVDSHAKGTPNFENLLTYSADFLDKIFIGQGELLLLNYLQGKLPEPQRVYTKKDIGGKTLGFREVELPDFSDFDLQKHLYLPATGTASCPHQCSFCSARRYYGEFRIKDPQQTAGEMIQSHKKYGHQLFFMTDAMLNPIISDLARALIKKDASVYYDAYFRVDDAAANIENTMLWRRGGLYRVRLGTESGSQRVLDRMNKGITPQQIKSVVSSLALAGIKTTTYWLVGHPGETEEDFQKTLDLIEELKDDIYQSETNVFGAYYSTQGSTDLWASSRVLLYPQHLQDMIIFKTWTLELDPPREEIYRRMYRITQHCKRLGLPNPYSLTDHFKADERWQRLHKNAVPPILDFLSKERYIDENKNIRTFTAARNTRTNSGHFEF